MLAVTTTRRPTADDERRARRYAAALKVPYIARTSSYAACMAAAEELTGRSCAGLIIFARKQASIWTPAGMLTYHPGMALRRVAALRNGESDTMTQAMRLLPGDQVLDCTAGMASDAVVAAYAVGAAGKVLALEAVESLALMLKTGLRHYQGQMPELTAAMRRVKVRHCRHEEYLAACADNSYDVVYFDPMFAEPVAGSCGIAPLRPLADHGGISETTLIAARRVARRVVVVKDRSDGPYVRAMAWDEIQGGRHSRIAYCILAAN